jgi:hypothetical protein
MSYVLWCTAKELKAAASPTGATHVAEGSASASSSTTAGGSSAIAKSKQGKFVTWVPPKKMKHK